MKKEISYNGIMAIVIITIIIALLSTIYTFFQLSKSTLLSPKDSCELSIINKEGITSKYYLINEMYEEAEEIFGKNIYIEDKGIPEHYSISDYKVLCTFKGVQIFGDIEIPFEIKKEINLTEMKKWRDENE